MKVRWRAFWRGFGSVVDLSGSSFTGLTVDDHLDDRPRRRWWRRR